MSTIKLFFGQFNDMSQGHVAKKVQSSEFVTLKFLQGVSNVSFGQVII